MDNKTIQFKKSVCQIFGCTMEQLTQQYKTNLKTLEEMYEKAVITGKKVNNYTAAQLLESVERFKKLANS